MKIKLFHLRFALICLFSLIACNVFSQNSGKLIVLIDSIAYPELLPQFPGGNENLMEFVSGNIKYPPKAKRKGNVGTSYISFVVKKTGDVANIKINKGTNATMVEGL